MPLGGSRLSAGIGIESDIPSSDANLLGEIIHSIDKNTETLLEASTEDGL